MSDVFLGIIAVAVLTMAMIQVGALIYAARLARRMERLIARLEDDLKPVFANLQLLTSEAAKAVALATAQVERADRLFGELSARVEQALTLVQAKILAPARDGAALLAGLRAALLAFRELRDSSRRRASAVEEEDALFIG